MEGKAYEFGLLRADLSMDDYNKLLCKEGELHVIGLFISLLIYSAVTNRKISPGSAPSYFTWLKNPGSLG